MDYCCNTHNHNTDLCNCMNETNTRVFTKNISLTLFSKGLMFSVVCEWWVERDTRCFQYVPDIFIQAFTIVVDSWKFIMLLLYIL